MRPACLLLSLILVLPSCTPSDKDSETGEPDSDAPDDTSDSGDSEDSGDPPREPTHVTGPACTEEPWPLVTPWNVLADHILAGILDEGMEDDIRALVGHLGDGSMHGPWEHELRGPWSSVDGRAWTGEPQTVLEQASVPDLVIDDDGLTWLFFTDASPEALLSAALSGEPQRLGIPTGGIFAARSTDGLDFERVELEIHGDKPLLMVDSDIRRLPDGRWRMFYLGVEAEKVCADSLDPSRVPAPHEVWTAVSDDLISWESEGVAYTFAEAGTDPASWCEGSTCWLSMRGAAISTDAGATFSETSVTLPDSAPQVPDVLELDEGWRMLWRKSGETTLRSAWSSDGSHFSDEGPTDAVGDSPAVTWDGAAAVLYLSTNG